MKFIISTLTRLITTGSVSLTLFALNVGAFATGFAHFPWLAWSRSWCIAFLMVMVIATLVPKGLTKLLVN